MLCHNICCLIQSVYELGIGVDFGRRLDAAVSKQTGHARVDFTKTVYVKLLPEMQHSLSGSFERLLSETAGNQLARLNATGVM